jgi:hypothetical protein
MVRRYISRWNCSREKSKGTVTRASCLFHCFIVSVFARGQVHGSTSVSAMTGQAGESYLALHAAIETSKIQNVNAGQRKSTGLHLRAELPGQTPRTWIMQITCV